MLPILEKTSLKDLCSRDNQYGRCFNKWRIKKKNQIEQELKQKWIEKKIYGQFIREMPENVDENKTWQWLSKCDLKKHCHVQHRNRPSGQTR